MKVCLNTGWIKAPFKIICEDGTHIVGTTDIKSECVIDLMDKDIKQLEEGKYIAYASPPVAPKEIRVNYHVVTLRDEEDEPNGKSV
jgi:hypothetical protein